MVGASEDGASVVGPTEGTFEGLDDGAYEGLDDGAKVGSKVGDVVGGLVLCVGESVDVGC